MISTIPRLEAQAIPTKSESVSSRSTRVTSNDFRQLRSLLRSLLGFEVRFRQNFSHSFYQSYAEAVLTGKLFFVDKARPQAIIELTLSEFLQLRDMIKNLLECEGSTPSGPDSKELCCVCMQRPMTLMLPCSVPSRVMKHAYCPECMEKYVLDLDEKKCPQCRRQFHEPKVNIKGKLTQILDNEKEIAEQLKGAIRDLLRKTNPQIGRL